MMVSVLASTDTFAGLAKDHQELVVLFAFGNESKMPELIQFVTVSCNLFRMSSACERHLSN
jgi:hypothetical protein